MKPTLRIAVVTRYYWPTEGGASIMLRRLAEAWSAMGHRVDVLATRFPPELSPRESMGGVRIRRAPSSEQRWIGTPLWFVRSYVWLRRRRADLDVVLVSMLKHAAAASLAASRPARLPVVLRTEGGGPTGDVAWQERDRFGGWIRKRCLRAPAVVAISEVIRRELVSAGYPPERIHLIPNAVATPERPWSASEARRRREELQLRELPTICFTGRLRPLKGVADLLRALPIVESSLGPCQLLIAGDGPERGNLERLATELGLADRVHFAGHVPDVADYLRAADLYVLPSYVEGMSVALLEAAALGMPALAGDIEANRALLPDALLPRFPVRNPQALAAAIRQRLRATEPSALQQLREEVRRHYGIEVVARSYDRLFRSIRH